MLYARLFFIGLLMVVIGATSSVAMIAKLGAVLVALSFVVASWGVIAPVLRGR